jgi:para-nitrobenzyl esterase
MKYFRYLNSLVLVWFMGCTGTERIPANPFTVVKTRAGFISGYHSDSIYVFKGIPFAQPPVGDKRWKPPVREESWNDTLSCTEFGPSPVQNDPKPFRMWTEEFITPNSLSEDCLHLNVWTGATRPDEKLPVLVWIYGGGFVSGSGACAVYDGTELAKEGIVYVTINYRVGVFGFMAHPELTAESEFKSSGNYGLLDQIAALRWVKENISAFGGDPEKVTIAGQSAGSMSVQSLVASPLARGLFHRAIAHSGALTGRPTPSLKDAEQVGVKLSAGIPSGDLAALRKLSSDSLLSLAKTLPFGSYFPIIDGYVIPSDPTKIFESKRHNDTPIMLGWVTGDGALAMGPAQSPDQFRSNARTTYGAKAPEFLKLFPATSAEEFKASQDKLALLRFCALADLRWAKANTSKSYVYEFNYVPTDKPGFPNYGTFHTSEVPFALKTLDKWDRPWVERDRRVEEVMNQYWLNFVKTGNPNSEGLPEWKAYDAVEMNVMQLNDQPEPKPGLYQDEFGFLEPTQK